VQFNYGVFEQAVKTAWSRAGALREGQRKHKAFTSFSR